MGKYNIVPATEVHAWLIAEELSPEICEELLKLSPKAPVLTIADNIRNATDSWSVFYKEQILAVFGVSTNTLLGEIAFPWLITSTFIKGHTKELLKGTRVVINHWLFRYEMLENYVPADFTSSLRWLKWAGFTIDAPLPIGVNGALIHRVELKRKAV